MDSFIQDCQGAVPRQNAAVGGVALAEPSTNGNSLRHLTLASNESEPACDFLRQTSVRRAGASAPTRRSEAAFNRLPRDVELCALSEQAGAFCGQITGRMEAPAMMDHTIGADIQCSKAYPALRLPMPNGLRLEMIVKGS